MPRLAERAFLSEQGHEKVVHGVGESCRVLFEDGGDLGVDVYVAQVTAVVLPSPSATAARYAHMTASGLALGSVCSVSWSRLNVEVCGRRRLPVGMKTASVMAGTAAGSLIDSVA